MASQSRQPPDLRRYLHWPTRMQKVRQFSLKALLVVTSIFATFFAIYAAMRSESNSQAALVSRFVELGGGYYEHEHTTARIGHRLGFEYPADKVRLVKGLARADWGMVPGWKCTDADVRLLAGFANLEDVYIENSRLTDIGLAQIVALPKLKNLQCRYCDLTECDLSTLSKSPTLKRLDFRESSVNMDSLVKLKTDAPAIEMHGIGK